MAITWLDEIDDEKLDGSTVLCRVDFNVSMDDYGNISDATRIEHTLPTIRYLKKKNAKIVLMSHLGRPKGKVKKELSLEPVANYFRDLINQEVIFVYDPTSDAVSKIASESQKDSIIFLENLRFAPGEEKNDPIFSKILARPAAIYINDAFGAIHRSHASVVGVTKHVDTVCGGLLLKKEVSELKKLKSSPKHPFVAIIGGAKVSGKIGVLSKLLHKIDTLIIGGAMAYTFLKARGENVGSSLVENDKINAAQSILKKAESMDVDVILPIDHVVVSNKSGQISKEGSIREIESNGFTPEEAAYDIGQKTIDLFTHALKNAQTIFFNGPMGVFEDENFYQGTKKIIEAIVRSNAYSVAGGGDSITAINKVGVKKEFDFISTGGGAALEFLEDKRLPGLDALGYYT